MGNTLSSRFNRIDWLAEGPFAPHIDAYKQYLTDRGYAANTFSNCMRSIVHFAQWTRSRRLQVWRIDESVVAEFLDRHLPECRCTGPICRDRRSLSAALGHLLLVLRARGFVALPTVRLTVVSWNSSSSRSACTDQWPVGGVHGDGSSTLWRVAGAAGASAATAGGGSTGAG